MQPIQRPCVSLSPCQIQILWRQLHHKEVLCEKRNAGNRLRERKSLINNQHLKDNSTSKTDYNTIQAQNSFCFQTFDLIPTNLCIDFFMVVVEKILATVLNAHFLPHAETWNLNTDFFVSPLGWPLPVRQYSNAHLLTIVVRVHLKEHDRLS